jgi:hypothetical protein
MGAYILQDGRCSLRPNASDARLSPSSHFVENFWVVHLRYRTIRANFQELVCFQRIEMVELVGIADDLYSKHAIYGICVIRRWARMP